MDKQIIVKLIIPLSILAILSAVMNNYLEFQGFFINLSTELIGIIVTVMYVDFIIKKRETEKWKGVDKKVSEAVRVFVNATISTIRNAFGYDLDIIDYRVQQEMLFNPNNISLMNEELIRISREILEPTALNRVQQLDQKRWKFLIEQLQYLHESDIKLLTVYGQKLTPKQYELLIEIQNSLIGATILYTTFPDIIGVPDEELPLGTRTSAVELKEALTKNSAESIRDLLEKVRELGSHLGDIKKS